MSLILGSVFYQLSDTTESLNNRCVLLFFALLFNALNSSLEVRSKITQSSNTLSSLHRFSRFTHNGPL